MAALWPSGTFEIDPSKAHIRDLEPNWQSSKNYSRQEMTQWMGHAREIQRLCREKNYSARDFQQLQQSDNPTERAIGETYHKLYNPDGNHHDYIKVEWVNDHYEVTNGRHRLALAQEAGLRHLPAHVSAPDRATLERLRADGDRIARGEIPQQERSNAPLHPGSTPNRPSTITPERL